MNKRVKTNLLKTSDIGVFSVFLEIQSFLKHTRNARSLNVETKRKTERRKAMLERKERVKRGKELRQKKKANKLNVRKPEFKSELLRRAQSGNKAKTQVINFLHNFHKRTSNVSAKRLRFKPLDQNSVFLKQLAKKTEQIADEKANQKTDKINP